MNVQELLEKLLPPVLSALAGGGLMWLLLFRSKLTRQRNELTEADFKSFQDVTGKYVVQLSELTSRIEALEDSRIDLLQRLADCEGRTQRAPNQSTPSTT